LCVRHNKIFNVHVWFIHSTWFKRSVGPLRLDRVAKNILVEATIDVSVASSRSFPFVPRKLDCGQVASPGKFEEKIGDISSVCFCLEVVESFESLAGGKRMPGLHEVRKGEGICVLESAYPSQQQSFYQHTLSEQTGPRDINRCQLRQNLPSSAKWEFCPGIAVSDAHRMAQIETSDLQQNVFESINPSIHTVEVTVAVQKPFDSRQWDLRNQSVCSSKKSV
jgi:hypothetical protein